MSSDFNPTLADETLMHSPPREDTDDTIARLYFGPQQSPEKRLIKSLLRQDDDTPRRRSARLSSPAAIHSPSPLPPYVAQQHVDTDQLEKYDSGRDTPDNNQDIQDEPSSALADRIIRAHDNPSPPPNTKDVPTKESESISPNLRQFNQLPAASEAPNPPSTPSAVPVEPPAGAVVVEEKGNTSTADLIDLNSISLDAPHPTEPAVVDELIPTSHNDISSHEVSILENVAAVADQITPSEERNATTSPNETAESSNQIPDKLSHVLPPHLASESQPLPLRRSKRHSSSPARTIPGAFNDFNTPIKPILPLRLPASTKVSKMQSRTGESPPPARSDGGNHESMLNAANNEDRSARKRKRQAGDTRTEVGRLGSLSPGSSAVLQQLVPKSNPETEPGPSNSRATAFTLTPLTFPQVTEQSTPAKSRDTIPDEHRTPLGRVPVESSPGKPGTRTFGGTIFKTQSLDDPNRSPARRVLVKDVKSSPLKSIVFSRERSGSAEPRPVFNGRSASAEPVFSRPPSSSSKIGSRGASQLPFPLISHKYTIPEEEGATASPVKSRATSAPPMAPTTPVKSDLKQPTPLSRIPRIGVKPYSRPPGPEKSKLPVPASRIRPPNSSVRSMTAPGSGSGNSSDDGRLMPTQIALLKRKREAEAKPPALNPQPQVIAMRQAPGIRAHERVPKPAPTVVNDEQIPIPSSEDNEPLLAPSTIDSVDSPDRQTRSASRVSKPVDSSVRTSTRTRTRDVGGSQESGARRTSRPRKTTTSNGDMFTSTSTTPPRLPPVRTRKPAEPGYAGLSALALKTLTTNNTVRNQQIVNMLETELVIKEGKRPESPTTKLRTISERQQTEKAQQRQERAERRARKVELGEIAESDMDSSFMSDIPRDDDGQPLKHRRGPGDEEDYETPERPARPWKRTRVDAEEQVQDEEGAQKNVQWDRDLFTAVYLDELPDNRAWPKNVSTKKSCLTKAAKAARLDPLGNVQDAEVPITQIITERVVVKRFVYEGEGEPLVPVEPGPEPDSDVDAEYTPEVKPLRVKSKGRKAKS